jgi:tetratricopeptide (TPR) repeat protein
VHQDRQCFTELLFAYLRDCRKDGYICGLDAFVDDSGDDFGIEPGDWLRREIETALATRRNIVPLMLDGFDFATPSIAKYLVGTLAPLRRYNGLPVVGSYFPEAMDKLRARHLNVGRHAVVHPPSAEARIAAEHQQTAAAMAAPVIERELTAEEWFERGLKASTPDEQVRCFTEVIRLNPIHRNVHLARGIAHQEKGDLDSALSDFADASALRPGHADARLLRANTYAVRANARRKEGDLYGANADLTEAVRLKPGDDNYWFLRGLVRLQTHDIDGAIADMTEALRLKADVAEYHDYRGFACRLNDDFDGALADYTAAIRLSPDDAEGYSGRAAVRRKIDDHEGALLDYAEAIRLKPSDANLYRGRARVRQQRREDSLAIDDLQQYLNLGGGALNNDEPEVEELIRVLKEKATSPAP